MKVFLDTNIILDLLAQRHPFYLAVAKLASLADRKEITLVSSSLSFTTVFYVLSKFESSSLAKEKLRRFKILCEVSSVDENVTEKALSSEFPDFEDAVQYFSALNADCRMIITRNGKDFKKSAIPFMSAEEYLGSR